LTAQGFFVPIGSPNRASRRYFRVKERCCKVRRVAGKVKWGSEAEKKSAARGHPARTPSADFFGAARLCSASASMGAARLASVSGSATYGNGGWPRSDAGRKRANEVRRVSHAASARSVAGDPPGLLHNANEKPTDRAEVPALGRECERHKPEDGRVSGSAPAQPRSAARACCAFDECLQAWRLRRAARCGGTRTMGDAQRVGPPCGCTRIH
jgi:hypothetical protein